MIFKKKHSLFYEIWFQNGCEWYYILVNVKKRTLEYGARDSVKVNRRE